MGVGLLPLETVASKVAAGWPLHPLSKTPTSAIPDSNSMAMHRKRDMVESLKLSEP